MFDTAILIMLLPAFCECLVLVGIHAYLGIHVIKRRIIFVDLALAQIAALGTLVAFLFGIEPHTTASYGFALGLTTLAAVVFAFSRFPEDKIPQEAVIGLIYAVAAAGAILLIDKAPHGAERLKDILTGSILWVEWKTIVFSAIIYAAVGAVHCVFWRRFLLISEDPDRARKEGVNVRLWDFIFFLTFGVVITMSVDVAGVLIVFVFLVGPAIMAVSITDRLSLQLIIGWAMGLVATVLGLTASFVADLPTGPAVIGCYALVMSILSGVVYNLRATDKNRAIKNTAFTVLAASAVICGILLVGRAFQP